MKDTNLEERTHEIKLDFVTKDGVKHKITYQTNAELVLNEAYEIFQDIFKKFYGMVVR